MKLFGEWERQCARGALSLQRLPPAHAMTKMYSEKCSVKNEGMSHQ